MEARKPCRPDPPRPTPAPRRRAAPAACEVVREVQVVREVEVVPVEVPVAWPRPVVVDKPLRSGQQVYARGADLVVLAMVSFGAEVIADGNIHVYAPLRGRAIAGARGNTQARIFSTCLEPQLSPLPACTAPPTTELPDNVRGQSRPRCGWTAKSCSSSRCDFSSDPDSISKAIQEEKVQTWPKSSS
jgi:septum site-determining protein MinC